MSYGNSAAHNFMQEGRRLTSATPFADAKSCCAKKTWKKSRQKEFLMMTIVEATIWAHGDENGFLLRRVGLVILTQYSLRYANEVVFTAVNILIRLSSRKKSCDHQMSFQLPVHVLLSFEDSSTHTNAAEPSEPKTYPRNEAIIILHIRFWRALSIEFKYLLAPQLPTSHSRIV